MTAENAPAPPVKKCDNCLTLSFCEQSEFLKREMDDHGWYCTDCIRKFEAFAVDCKALIQAVGKPGRRVYEPWEIS